MMLSRRSMLVAPLASGLAAAVGTAASQGSAPKRAPVPLKVQRLAWAGARLELLGATLFIDAIAPDPSAGQPGPPLTPGAGRNFALVTHHHSDHCDPQALKSVLGENGYLVCHEEVGRYVDPRPVRIQLVRLYEPVFLSRGSAEFVAFAVPAADGLGSPQVSWVVDAGGRRIIHCGDTLWHGYWWDIARAYGPFDLAFLPINGFRQTGGRYTDEGIPMGMTPEQAAAAAHILRPRTVIPIHYGSQGNKDYVEAAKPAQTFTALAQENGIETKALAPGEELTL